MDRGIGYRSCRPSVAATEGNFVLSQQTRGVTTGGDAQTLARFLGVGLDRALADIEQTRHLLGLQMTGDQAEYFLLALRQRLHSRRPVPHCHRPYA